MNSDFPQDERAQLEAKLTALLLGELHADEIARLSEAMEQDPELAALYERLKITIELVREGTHPAAQAGGHSGPLKLSDARREKLLASFKTVAPEEFARPRRMADWLVPMAACAAVLVVLAVVILPSLSRAKYRSQPVYAGGDYRAELQLAKNAESVSPARPEARREPAPPAPVAAPISSMSPNVMREPGNNLAIAPAVQPPALTPSTQIVLPAEQDGDKGVRAGQAASRVNVMHLENADPAQVSRVLKQFAAGQTNAVAFDSQFFRQTSSYAVAAASDLSDSANKLRGQQSDLMTRNNQSDGSQTGGFTGGTSLGFGAGPQVLTNGIAGGVMVDPDSHNLTITADAQVSRELLDVVEKLDRASVPGSSNGVPILADVPIEGRLFRSTSTVAANGDFKTAVTRDDVGGLRSLATNALVASQPFMSHDSWQDGSINGATNSYSYDAAVAQSQKGDGNTATYVFAATNSGVIEFNDVATHSAVLAKEGEQKPPSATDGLLTSGLRAGAIELPSASAPIAANGGGGGFGGGGAGGGGRVGSLSSAPVTRLPAGGKPVELAAVAKSQLVTRNAKDDTALPKPVVPPPTPQPEILTRKNAFSTFSLNVSDVSFKLAAASLEKGQMPEPASIRSEEFINAFDYRDPDALPGVPIAFASERARYPFAQNRELLRFSLKTAAAGRQAGRPLNIVLLLDNSGSMERADRVGIIREALRVLAGQLQASDSFSVVTFARTAQLRVDGIPGNQAAAAAEEIAKLTPEGGTNLGDALDAAYETALHHYQANGDNRVVLLTDGAANLGDVDAEVLKKKVEAHRRQGVALDCFGIGWEGYNDDLLEVLTRNGDGRYGFINTPEEASTEFVAQIAGALHVAAADVKVQVEFNPKRVTSYRQMGYAKHQLTKEQFRDNTVDAAEIAAQEAGNALYTIEVNPEGEGSIATVRVHYKVPGTGEYREQAWDVPYTAGAVAMDQASPAMRLAATASAFSEWLATSPFAAEVSTDRLLNYLSGVPQVYGADKRPAKLEWMIRQARSISGK